MVEESGVHIGYVIFFVTAVGFVCSLTYNCGYFWLFDAGIRVLSISDILTSYSLWVPGLGTLVFGYSFDLLLQRIDKNQWLNKNRKRHKLLKKIFALPHIIFICSSIAVLFAFILFGFAFRPILIWLSSCYLLLSLYGHAAASKLLSSHQVKLISAIMIFVLITLSLLFMLGMDHAINDAKLQKANATISFIESKEKLTPVILLRHLEKGVLVKELHKQNYILYTWDDISSIQILAHGAHFKGILGK